MTWFYGDNDPNAPDSVLRDVYPSQKSDMGKWVDNQRYAYQTKTLPASRVAALEAIPVWTWRVQCAEACAPREIRAWPQGALAKASASVAPMELD